MRLQAVAVHVVHDWAGQVWRIGAILAGAVFCAVTSGADSPAVRFSITSSGQPKPEIVVAATQPELPITFAAQELERCAKEMSGAELRVVHALSKESAIVLAGRASQRDKQALEDPREEDRYRLNIDAQKLQIEGAVLFGVYDVLERLGCGWCVPGDDSVPKRDTLEMAPVQVDTRPAFQYRMLLDFPMMSVAQNRHHFRLDRQKSCSMDEARKLPVLRLILRANPIVRNTRSR